VLINIQINRRKGRGLDKFPLNNGHLIQKKEEQAIILIACSSS